MKWSFRRGLALPVFSTRLPLFFLFYLFLTPSSFYFSSGISKMVCFFYDVLVLWASLLCTHMIPSLFEFAQNKRCGISLSLLYRVTPALGTFLVMHIMHWWYRINQCDTSLAWFHNELNDWGLYWRTLSHLPPGRSQHLILRWWLLACTTTHLIIMAAPRIP